jgi:hypothetical protein
VHGEFANPRKMDRPGSPAEAARAARDRSLVPRARAGSIGIGLFSEGDHTGRMGGRPAVSGSHGGVRRARIAKAAAQTRMVSGGES